MCEVVRSGRDVDSYTSSNAAIKCQYIQVCARHALLPRCEHARFKFHVALRRIRSGLTSSIYDVSVRSRRARAFTFSRGNVHRVLAKYQIREIREDLLETYISYRLSLQFPTAGVFFFCSVTANFSLFRAAWLTGHAPGKPGRTSARTPCAETTSTTIIIINHLKKMQLRFLYSIRFYVMINA